MQLTSDKVAFSALVVAGLPLVFNYNKSTWAVSYQVN